MTAHTSVQDNREPNQSVCVCVSVKPFKHLNYLYVLCAWKKTS